MRIGIDCRKIADFGIGTYVRGLVGGLASIAGDEEYVLFVPRDAEGLPRGFEQVVVDAPNYSISELHLLARALDRARIDLFHAPHFVLPWSGRPSFATIHDVIPFHYPPPNPVARLYLATMIPRALRKSERVLTVTNAAKQAILDTFDCAAEKVVVAPNGIDEIFFSDAIAPARMGRYILFAGNDKPHKNVGRLVEAFERVRRADSSLQLVLVGGAFERFTGRDGIVAMGFVSTTELVSLFRGAIALAMPSLEEGFGLPAVEAMAARTPVIASDIASLAEVCGDAALRFDPRS
ncbi:MAG: glycosyltransferase family 1 protein, partial [Thermoanaerobaculia bacterium]